MLKVKMESWQKLPSERKASKVWTKSLKNLLVAEWKMTSSMYLQWTTSSHRLKQREHYRYFCKLILQKSLEAGRRSLGSQGARAPPIFGKSPNCQNKSRNLWDAEMFDHAMKLPGSPIFWELPGPTEEFKNCSSKTEMKPNQNRIYKSIRRWFLLKAFMNSFWKMLT